MPAGRPTELTKKLGLEICTRIVEDSESLRSICRDDKMPCRKAVHNWLLWGSQEDAKPIYREFVHQYEIAVNLRTDNMFDELLEIADDGTNDWMEKELASGRIIDVLNGEHVSRSKLRVDVRKWALSKLMPKKYGDKVTQEIDLTSHGKSGEIEALSKLMQKEIEKLDKGADDGES